ncbi:DUF2203 domain-containing protein [Salisediminibacterium selenitireducens]|uniref:DUF2203 domain-containing protein n=1 Tax=Bacillus selenitireducens (strain ATCC 700615 / DSM 15326 / MLS10) TaxID=439292 RepID=D6XUE1_BACIE|nr:DUF2203 domain-containing protein [Salisediminibacterium selenitireducens]ADH99427.1 Protein of unknown function DUF2203 [[Bacillus] selenitireducens MLS10]
MADKQLFTIDEANALIPLMEQEIDALRALNKEFKSKVNTLNKSGSVQTGQAQENPSDEQFIAESKLEFIEIQARLHVNNIERHGAQLKDVEVGLIDFPSKLNEKEILLCWKYGEKEISHYHGPEDGYQGRKPLE